jgi:F0F1-type ATP synthase delta subunit
MAKLAALYAAALFELCVEKGAEDAFYDQALLVSGALSEPDARRILLHPHIITAEKQKLFGKAFENELHQDLQSFLFLVIEKNRRAFSFRRLPNSSASSSANAARQRPRSFRRPN